MQHRPKYSQSAIIAALLSAFVMLNSGCAMWRSASAIPRLSSKQGEREVLEQAKNDPFPSPADVGLQSAK